MQGFFIIKYLYKLKIKLEIQKIIEPRAATTRTSFPLFYRLATEQNTKN